MKFRAKSWALQERALILALYFRKRRFREKRAFCCCCCSCCSCCYVCRHEHKVVQLLTFQFFCESLWRKGQTCPGGLALGVNIVVVLSFPDEASEDFSRNESVFLLTLTRVLEEFDPKSRQDCCEYLLDLMLDKFTLLSRVNLYKGSFIKNYFNLKNT